MFDITEIFKDYLLQFGSPDIAEFEFKKAINDDAELRESYREWCREVGSSEKDGFFDFCDEYQEQENDVWENLSDYNEE